MTSRLTSLIAALGLLAASTAAAAQELAVPYLPQSPALCGGAAIAMVYRYWGDRHAAAEDFAPLVDRRAGGIADSVLVDAIRRRGWRTERIEGSIESLRQQIAAQRPVVILVDAGRGKYHYVVVTGADEDGVIVHDPSRGPSRHIAAADLTRAWSPTHFWALVVLPPEHQAPSTQNLGTNLEPGTPEPGTSACDALINTAVARVKAEGFEGADDVLGAVASKCPTSAAPWSELAGVRIAQRRWPEAAQLAERAVTLDPLDAYAWDVLGTSRFVQNDGAGALRAWNHIGKPRLDSVAISGPAWARYDLVARALDLTPNAVLTERAFARAERRLSELPDRSASRLTFEPAPDGFATVRAALVEQSAAPDGAIEWSARAARTLMNRELEIRLPGFTGQNELWSASWRWWEGRPRLGFSFAAPRFGRWPGVWRADASWESQRYATEDLNGTADLKVRTTDVGTTTAETRAHGGLTISDWLTGNLRYEAGAAVDVWNGAQRTASASASIERRFFGDRLSMAGSAALFAPISAGQTFHSGDIRATATSSRAEQKWIGTWIVGATAVSDAAPLALWPGAGTGQGRSALLRAHPLLTDGTIHGPAFGRTLVYESSELQRWFDRPAPLRAGIAGFVDTARAARRLDGSASPWLADLGIGLRLKAPGVTGTLRVDVAHSMRDSAMAVTAAWDLR